LKECPYGEGYHVGERNRTSETPVVGVFCGEVGKSIEKGNCGFLKRKPLKNKELYVPRRHNRSLHEYSLIESLNPQEGAALGNGIS